MLFWGNSGTTTYFYVGQSTNLHARIVNHKCHLKQGVHDNQRLQRVYNKYGMPESMIIKKCDPEQLNHEEQLLLDAFFHHPGCCNINPAADNTYGWKRTEESKRKISDRRKGVKLSNDHRVSISDGLKRAYSCHRKKPELKGPSNPFYGRKHTQEAKEKMRSTPKNVGGSNVKARLVIDLQTGIFYDYAGEAAKAKGIQPQYLRKMLTGWSVNKTSFAYC